MRHAVAGTFAGFHILLAVHASCVGAQPVDAVVIEATRFPEVARTLPASVSVLTAEDIAASAARTLPELLAQQAGVAMHDFFGNNAATSCWRSAMFSARRRSHRLTNCATLASSEAKSASTPAQYVSNSPQRQEIRAGSECVS